jgi:hypothetical protein
MRGIRTLLNAGGDRATTCGQDTLRFDGSRASVGRLVDECNDPTRRGKPLQVSVSLPRAATWSLALGSSYIAEAVPCDEELLASLRKAATEIVAASPGERSIWWTRP